VGYLHASVGEVARRAGVSKGVVTYHFATKGDLINEVVAEIFTSIAAEIGPRLEDVAPREFVSTYLQAWVDYFRTHRRYMFAIAEIWTNFRDESGRPVLGGAAIAPELAEVELVLAAGQATGHLRPFSTRVLAVSLKAALDGLLGQLAADPTLDLEAYGAELIALFDLATRAAPDI
jgi:TetR/AcrR family fatty acid metabolism transcriptional regulator